MLDGRAINLDSAGATQVRWRTIPADSPSLTSLAERLLDIEVLKDINSKKW